MSIRFTSSRQGCVFIIDKEDTMPHDIQQVVYVGKAPWHGLGTPLPANGSYEEIVQVAGFFTEVEQLLHSPPMESPIADMKALLSLPRFRGHPRCDGKGVQCRRVT